MSLVDRLVIEHALHYVNALGAIGWPLSGALRGTGRMSTGQLKVMNALIPVVRRLESLAEPPFGTSLVAVAQ
jgi:hypothetical protein